jgi:hypothetical protein
MFYSLREQIHLSCKHVNFFNWMHTSFTGLESIVAPPLIGHHLLDQCLCICNT